MRDHYLRIAILDCTKTIYNEQSSTALPLGGIERCVISLSRALADKGHHVQVFAHEKSGSDYNNIRWVSKSGTTDFKADIVIACNDPKLFDLYALNSGHKDFKPFLWHHNPVGFWKTLRKGRFLPLFKWRPTHIFLGAYHSENYPKFLPCRKKAVIEHGVEESILSFHLPVTPPQPHAVFISQAYRGLENLVQLWKDYIFPDTPSAKLFIYSTYQPQESDLAAYGIFVEGRLPRQELLQHLSSKRLALIPGHEDETFCLSATESHCLGLPVISFGIGALKERIHNGIDGFVTKSNQDFAEKTLLLLQNYTLWAKMSQNASSRRLTASWQDKAALWESLFRATQNDQR